MPLNRREAVASIAATLAAGACASGPGAPEDLPPVVFVHGNGDTASIWLTTVWRFESNGWPRERLHALDLPNPTARDDHGVAQPGRSSIDEYAQYLAKEVDAVLARTGARRVALVGNSRGGLAIRHYVRHFGGAAKVSHAVLGGTPNHGIWVDPAFRANNEFNGASAFMQALNAPQGPNGDEVTPGPRWLTLRSDRNDKYAQPDGAWIGARGKPTYVSYEGPALKGATNVVLDGADHREVSFGSLAFAETFRFIAGRAPATVEIAPEAGGRVVLNGKVSGQGAGGPTNLPLEGAAFAVYAVDRLTGERRGEALVRKTIGADGLWGPLVLEAPLPLEFVVAASGHATTHVYRAPLPRSSGIVHLRAARLAGDEKDAGAVVLFTRPRGYFGVGRDEMRLDGQSPPPGVPPGVAGVATSRLRLPAGASRTVVGEFNGERIAARTWPAAGNELTVLELQG